MPLDASAALDRVDEALSLIDVEYLGRPGFKVRRAAGTVSNPCLRFSLIPSVQDSEDIC